MSAIVSRWPVVVTTTITTDDLAADGRLTQAAVRRIGDEAVGALVELAPMLAAADRTTRPTSARLDGAFAGAGPVTAAASATEIRPDSIEVAVRIRPADGTPATVDAVWTVCVRRRCAHVLSANELIALVHAATHLC